MSQLRQRFVEDLQLKGLSERTQECYTNHVWKLAKYYKKAPDVLNEEEIRQYFLYMKNVKKYSESFFKQGFTAIKFLYENTLNRNWTIMDFVIPRKEKKLPDVLTIDEVRTILSRTRLLRYRVCLTAIYSLGLRLSEGVSLHVRDIDSGRMLVHIHHGKGAKDRFVSMYGLKIVR